MLLELSNIDSFLLKSIRIDSCPIVKGRVGWGLIVVVDVDIDIDGVVVGIDFVEKII